jgi:hypothetical protein
MAIERLDHPPIGEAVRHIKGRFRFGKLGKRSTQAIVIRRKDTISPYAIGDFQGRRKRPAKNAIN